tara:strand:+ start:10572 stop:10841 length:270 start_codon:yes stop_codon:yes gene_type:complete
VDALGCISIACHGDNSSQAAGLLPLQFGRISSRVRGAPIRADAVRDACPLSDGNGSKTTQRTVSGRALYTPLLAGGDGDDGAVTKGRDS